MVRSVAHNSLHISGSQLKHAKCNDGIYLDGHPVHTNVRVQKGQELTITLTEAKTIPILPYDLPLQLPYRDEAFVVVDKPAPLPSVPSTRNSQPTLQNALFAHLGCPKGFLYRPVNRLDKGTSGLMTVAMNAHAQHQLQSMLHTPAFTRHYLAICQGIPPQTQGTICQPIAKAEGATIRRQVSEAGKEAVTHYRVLQKAGNRTLLSLQLETGRTHQIRVHMQWLGCPVVGDFLYGEETEELPGRFALHSHRLCISHPFSGQSLSIESPLPSSLQRLLESK